MKARAVLLAAALALAFAARAADTVDVRLIAINDFHGNLESANLALALADPGAPAGSKPVFVPTGGASAVRRRRNRASPCSRRSEGRLTCHSGDGTKSSRRIL